MKKLLGLIMAAVFMLSMAGTSAMADVTKGQKIYLKKLKRKCGMNGAEMARKHTQAEWKTIGTDGLEAEVKKQCPKVKRIKSRYLQHIYDFLHNYASDSGNVPSC